MHEQLRLNGELLAGAVEDFDAALTRCIVEMEQCGQDQATVTLKLKIDTAGDAPVFEHSVKTNISVKDSVGGYARRDNATLKYDRTAQCFVLVPTAASLFDMAKGGGEE